MALVDTSIVNPAAFQLTPQTGDITQRLIQVLGQKRKEKLANDLAQANKLKEDFKLVGDQFSRLSLMTDNTKKRTELAILGRQAIERGEDPTVFAEALKIDKDNHDQLNMYLERVAIQAGNVKEVIDQRTREAGGKDQFEAVKDEEGNIIAQRNIATGKLIKAPEAITRKATGEPTAKVKATEFLSGGGVRVIMDDKTSQVVLPTPEEIKFIREAEERGVDLQQRRAKGRGLGAGAAKIASKAFDSTEKLRANNLRLKKVIAAVGEGADTGPISSMLPSFRASTRRLIALKNELGLDVVSAVTFGALSERELEIAMDTGLPTKMKGPDLVKWAQDKIAAQEKLGDYFEEQAIFLSKGDNNAATWIEHTRANKKVQPDTQTTTPPRFKIEVVE